ncbi:hypothetical protein B0H13DRAFT_2681572 [Mycena leptocephala]|nr:hypothetical protein B0H13DRAFT_2681572 [Mycena leptocephala]
MLYSNAAISNSACLFLPLPSASLRSRPRVFPNTSNLSWSNRSPNTSSPIFRFLLTEIAYSTPKYAIFAIFTNEDALISTTV